MVHHNNGAASGPSAVALRRAADRAAALAALDRAVNAAPGVWVDVPFALEWAGVFNAVLMAYPDPNGAPSPSPQHVADAMAALNNNN